MKESNVDVLIIGAGPAGLMAANAFAAAGVNVRAVDKRCVEGLSITNLLTTLHCISRPSKVAAGQADGIQPRTIEVFQASHIIWASPPVHSFCFIPGRAMVLQTAYFVKETKCISLHFTTLRLEVASP